VLDGELIKEGWEELHTISALRQSFSCIKNKRLKLSALETTWYMRNRLLRDTDWASMAHSLEVRLPFVDIELFRTVTRFVHNANPPNKRDMAMIPVKQLPTEVLNRKKTGFSIPVQEWLLDSIGSNMITKGRGLRSWANFLQHKSIKI